MSAPLGFDRSYSSSQTGTEMLNIDLNATARAAMYATCEMTDEECGESSASWVTPAARIADGSEWVEFRCANWFTCGSRESSVVVIDSYDKVSEMHLCGLCYLDAGTNYPNLTVKVRDRRRTPHWVIAQNAEYVAAIEAADAGTAGFVESDEIPEPLDKYTMMRRYLTQNSAFEPRAKIRVVGNVSNNNGRRASLSGDSEAGFVRPWIIKSTMRNAVNFERYYLVRHMITGESRIVWGELLHNLY